MSSCCSTSATSTSSAASTASSSTVDHPSSDSKPSQKVVLVSIDGWGISAEKKGNAIANAQTPNMTMLEKEFLHSRLDASGLAVGLPEGVMGNSEVGHLTMGAGRVDFQDLVRINKSITEKTFQQNPTTLQAIDRAKKQTGRIHLFGLISDGAVHSHIQHLFRFLELFKSQQVPDTYIHFFADGRDTPPTTATKYLKEVQDFTSELKYGKLATVQGRYYAMDRDKRWERILVAYDALTSGEGDKVETSSADKIIDFVEARYKAEETDEFLRPIIVDKQGLVQDGDTLLFINFRSDRMREITSVFARMTELNPLTTPLPFDAATPPKVVRKNLSVIQMTQYDEKIQLPTVFAPQTMINGLPEWISRHNVKQFHTAETEKYAHVTFFFAGGKELACPGEDREMIASPKVATYNLAPEMSQDAVGKSVIRAIESGQYAFIMCNLAAPDMVGHTGHYNETVIACTECDRVIGEMWEACKKAGYIFVVTSDHGNAEEMFAADGVSPKTSHTTNFVPLIIASPLKDKKVEWLPEVAKVNQDEKMNVGGLSDVAPTVLSLMGLRVPKEMTGKPLAKVV